MAQDLGLGLKARQASQLVFDNKHPPSPPLPNHFYHYEKLIFNKAYWYLVLRGVV